MRNKALFLALTLIVACGAGPVRTNPAAPQAGLRGPAAPVQAIAQVGFKGSEGMTIQWDTVQIGQFDSTPITVNEFKPVFQNFQVAHSYRLKLSNIPNRDGLTLYPTLTINAISARTRAYLDHNAIPVKFSEADFDQVQNGNFVTKVIFLPAPQYQNLALAGGVDTIVNTQLPAGADPIVEAQKRGAILAIVQIGNKDLSVEGTSFSEGLDGNLPNQDLPISGVNAPAWGIPASQSDIPMTELPTVPAPQPEPFITPVRPVPSTSVPPVEGDWANH